MNVERLFVAYLLSVMLSHQRPQQFAASLFTIILVLFFFLYSQLAVGSCPSLRCWEWSPGSLGVSWLVRPVLGPGPPSSGWPRPRTGPACCSRPSRGPISPHTGSEKGKRREEINRLDSHCQEIWPVWCFLCLHLPFISFCFQSSKFCEKKKIHGRHWLWTCAKTGARKDPSSKQSLQMDFQAGFCHLLLSLVTDAVVWHFSKQSTFCKSNSHRFSFQIYQKSQKVA